MMEGGKKEINLSGLEDKNVQKYLIKLMKNLKISPSPKNPFAYRITNINVKTDVKKKFTTDIDDIIAECLTSYYYLVKSIFEYTNYMLNNKEEAGAEKNLNEENLQEEESEDENSEDEKMHFNQNIKKLNKEKLAMDY